MEHIGCCPELGQDMLEVQDQGNPSQAAFDTLLQGALAIGEDHPALLARRIPAPQLMEVVVALCDVGFLRWGPVTSASSRSVT